MAPQGAVCILGAWLLHPSSFLIVWLAGVIATQFFSLLALCTLAVFIGLAGSVVRMAWIGYLRRARWLFLSLWLILAYNTPGEAFLDLNWAPTEEGIGDATLQSLRLVVMLGGLAWLFDRLGRNGLVSALWGFLAPMNDLGIDSRRFVLRLSMVLANLEQTPEKGGWRKIISGQFPLDTGPQRWVMTPSPWRLIDVLQVGAALALFSGALML